MAWLTTTIIFFLGFFKNGIHALVRCLHGMGWMEYNTGSFVFIGKVSPEDTPPTG
jgi:hypothetical protein